MPATLLRVAAMLAAASIAVAVLAGLSRDQPVGPPAATSGEEEPAFAIDPPLPARECTLAKGTRSVPLARRRHGRSPCLPQLVDATA
jgi:hypothetical protein